MASSDLALATARLVAGAALISFTGVLVELASVEPTRSAFLRSAYALPVLVLVSRALAHQHGRTVPRLIPIAVAMGTLEGVEVVLYHAAIPRLGVGLATLLVSLQILFTVGFGAIFFGERPSRGFWLGLPTILLGLVVLTRPGEATSVDPVGLALGAAAAVLYAGFVLGLRWLRERGPELGTSDVIASATPGIVLATGLSAAATGTAAPPSDLPSNLWLVALALCTPVAGWWLITSSIEVVPAQRTGALLLLQPGLAVVWGWWFFGELDGAAQLAGAGLLLLGITTTTVVGRSPGRAPPDRVRTTRGSRGVGPP